MVRQFCLPEPERQEERLPEPERQEGRSLEPLPEDPESEAQMETESGVRSARTALSPASDTS